MSIQNSVLYSSLIVSGILFQAATLSPARAAESELGSSKEAENYMSNDYERAAVLAMPKFQAADLSRKFEEIRKKYPRGSDTITVHHLRELEKVFALPAGDFKSDATYYDNGKVAYEVNPASGRVAIVFNTDDLPSLNKAKAKELAPQVIREQKEYLKKLGIDTTQVLFSESGFMYQQTSSKKGSSLVPPSEVEVDSIFSYGLRALEGILVDGSHFRLASKAPQKLDTLAVRWPRFEFHPLIKSFEIRSANELIKEAAGKIRVSAHSNKVNVKMAVVFRPVLYKGQQTFIPSLRVGVRPDNGEAGEIFYLNLIHQALEFQEFEQTDRPMSTTG